MRQLVKQIYLILLYAAQIRDWHFYKFPYLNTYKGKKAFIMSNGPSLRNTLKDYDEGKVFLDEHSFWVNLGPLDEHFYTIKPHHLCFSDPMFIRDYEPKKTQVRKMYEMLNERVDWDLTIYGCFWKADEHEQLRQYSGITNPNIKFVRMNRKYCNDLTPKLRYALYKKGYFMVPDSTIANTAIFIALIEGYSEIEVYGCDHNQFLELAVNEKNQMCMRDTHFFDSKELDLRPIYKPYGDYAVWRVHEYMGFCWGMFCSHEMLRKFADYLGVRILNCTPGSMIDSYERKSGC